MTLKDSLTAIKNGNTVDDPYAVIAALVDSNQLQLEAYKSALVKEMEALKHEDTVGYRQTNNAIDRCIAVVRAIPSDT